MSFLPGIDHITDSTLDEQLVENIISFFDWGLLNIGAFINVKRPRASSLFHRVDVPNFVYGRVWESIKGNWVWESGISYPIQPIQISGVYVDNSFIPKDQGYYINYPDGQIVFDNALLSSSKVEMEYSYRRFNFYEADSDWFYQVVFDPLPESGLREVLAKNRIYLPAVIVEPVSDATFTPLQIGDYSVIERQPILFHIITDQDEDKDKLVYILKRMYQRTIWLYDINKIAEADKFQITINGSVSPNALMYPDMVNQFAWKKCRFTNIRPQEITRDLPLFRAVVRADVEINMP